MYLVRSEPERRLGRRLEVAGELARMGAHAAGRELCAAIFLEHASLPRADHETKQRFIECLLLLRMTNLLTRFLEACAGIRVEIAIEEDDGAEHMAFALPSGERLRARLPQAGLDRHQRERFAAFWGQRLLELTEGLGDAGSARRRPVGVFLVHYGFTPESASISVRTA